MTFTNMNLFGWLFFTLVPITGIAIFYMIFSIIYDVITERIEREFEEK